MKQYDVIIIGAGPSGIFCAYELIHAKKNLKILMIEKGRRSKRENVRNVRQKSALDVNLVPSRPDLPERELFLTVNCHFPRMSEEICRKF